jgi:hypothetical protein
MKRDVMSSGETPARPVLRYHGGKFGLAPWVLSFFPRHAVYVDPFAGDASCQSKLGGLAVELRHVLLNVTVPHRQSESTAPGRRFGREAYSIGPWVVDLWRHSKPRYDVTNNVFQFGFQGQCCAQACRRQQGQAGLVAMNSRVEFLMMVKNKFSVVGYFSPFLWTHYVRLIVAITPVWARWWPIDKRKLIQRKRRRVEHLTDECRSVPTLLCDLSICHQKRGRDRRDSPYALNPRCPLRLIEANSEAPQDKVDSYTGEYQ